MRTSNSEISSTHGRSHPARFIEQPGLQRRAYECEYLIKGTGDGLIAYVIAPKRGSYDDFVVFAGTDERLYVLKQYARFVRHRSEGDIAYVTFDATFLDKANLTYPAGDYTIKPDDGTWETLTLADYVITFEGGVATIKRKV